MRFSPMVGIPKGSADTDPLVERARQFSARTISTYTGGDWSDSDVRQARRLLDDCGLSVGEFCWLRVDLNASSSEQREKFKRHLSHAAMLRAHCAGFAMKPEGAHPFDPVTEKNWDRDTWLRCMDRVADLLQIAREQGAVVAAHPHLLTPLNSIERFRELLGSFDSTHLKALLDPVNLTHPADVFDTAQVINDLFDALHGHIAAIHTKDILLTRGTGGLLQLEETVPGRGVLDYRVLLRRASVLAPEVTLQVEHFEGEDIVEGQDFISAVAAELGLTID